MAAGRAHCQMCGYSFPYFSMQDFIRQMDDHYESEHPGAERTEDERQLNDSQVGWALHEAKCPHCSRRYLLADSKEAHPKGEPVMHWTAYDRKFLAGLRISQL